MRLLIACAILPTLMAAASAASAQPAGVTSQNGQLTTAEGATLHIWAEKTRRACAVKPCTELWSPFAPQAADKASGDWTITQDAYGAPQWAYRGWPLFIRSAPWPDPASPRQYGWFPAASIEGPVGDFLELRKGDPSRWTEPKFSRPPNVADDYPAASIRAEEEGVATVTFCITQEGRAAYPEITKSSGFPRLDLATAIASFRLRFTPPQLDGKPATLCNKAMEMEWTLNRAKPPPPTP